MAKRRAHGEGSLIQIFGKKDPLTGVKKLKSPYFFAQYYDARGKQVRVNTKQTTRAKALVELRRLMGKSEDGAPNPNDLKKTTYADLRAALLASYAAEGNKSLLVRADGSETIMGLSQLDKFFDYDGNSPGPSVTAITTDLARKFVKQRRAEGVGNSVINRSLQALRRMLNIAKRDNKIPDVPFIEFQREPDARKGFVTDEEFGRLIKNLPAHLRPLIAMLFFTGVRLGEALAIEWGQIDFDAGLVRLYATKNDERRVVPLPSILRMLLQPIKPKTGRVFDATNLRKEWMSSCAAAGLGTKIERPERPYDALYEGLTIHDLRRSAVRNLLRAGVPESVAMKISGHRTRSVFDRYAISSESDLRAAMSKVETNGISETLVKLTRSRRALKGRKLLINK